MKKILLIGLVLVMLVSFVAADAGTSRVKKFTGYNGWVNKTMTSGDANFMTNFNDGEIQLPGTRGTSFTLTKKIQKDEETDNRYQQMSKMTKMVPRTTGTKTPDADCMPGEYRLTNMKDGHYYGAEKCVSGMWRRI